jgi:YfiH family protein
MRTCDHDRGLVTRSFRIDGAEVTAAMTTRSGGVSTGVYESLDLAFHVGDDPDAVAENRWRLCRALDLPPITVPDQQHGTRVVVVHEQLAGAGFASLTDAQARLGSTDALITDLVGVPLGILVADCAPVVLYDPVRRCLGVVHVGRAGAVDDVLGATIGRLVREYTSSPADLQAGIGPCIGQAGYEIGGAALERTRQAFGDDLLEPTRPGHAAFDLLGAVTRRLEQHGVPAPQVELPGTSTDGDPALFSDRAARPCGRQMLVAMLRSA